MLFSSISFLYVFLPAVLLCYTLVPRRWKNAVLLVFSLLFYAAGEPVYISLLLLSSILNYIYALLVEKFRGRRGAKIALVSSIVCNLLLLGFFKYADFLIGAVNGLLGTDIPLLKIPLPNRHQLFHVPDDELRDRRLPGRGAGGAEHRDAGRVCEPVSAAHCRPDRALSDRGGGAAPPHAHARAVCRRRAALYRRASGKRC